MTKRNPDNDHLVTCTIAICDKDGAKNPVAWFDLEAAGITREAMQAVVAAGQWGGPPPLFDAAPDREGGFWKYLATKAS